MQAVRIDLARQVFHSYSLHTIDTGILRTLPSHGAILNAHPLREGIPIPGRSGVGV